MLVVWVAAIMCTSSKQSTRLYDAYSAPATHFASSRCFRLVIKVVTCDDHRFPPCRSGMPCRSHALFRTSVGRVIGYSFLPRVEPGATLSLERPSTRTIAVVTTYLNSISRNSRDMRSPRIQVMTDGHLVSAQLYEASSDEVFTRAK